MTVDMDNWLHGRSMMHSLLEHEVTFIADAIQKVANYHCHTNLIQGRTTRQRMSDHRRRYR
jgi:hypothetical protein